MEFTAHVATAYKKVDADTPQIAHDVIHAELAEAGYFGVAVSIPGFKSGMTLAGITEEQGAAAPPDTNKKVG
jgi:hypothetical protein